MIQKIFSRKVCQSKVYISDKISSPHKDYLVQARGVIDNYLRDKKCTVSIGNCPLHNRDYLKVSDISP